MNEQGIKHLLAYGGNVREVKRALRNELLKFVMQYGNISVDTVIETFRETAEELEIIAHSARISDLNRDINSRINAIRL